MNTCDAVVSIFAAVLTTARHVTKCPSARNPNTTPVAAISDGIGK